MAVYSQFATGSFDGESIVANESYVGAIGAYQMMAESSMNEHAIFEHVLGCDFVEAQANHGYVSESTLEAVNEASGEGIFSKVVAFFTKLIEKIKGIIQNMIDKISAMFTKDGKKLVNKFKKTINTKMANGTYGENFKYKWSASKNLSKLTDAQVLDNKVFDVTAKVPDSSGSATQKSIGTVLSNSDTYESYSNNNGSSNGVKNDLQKGYEDAEKNDYHKFNTITNDDLKDYKDKVLTAWLGSNTTVEDFDKDVDEHYFDDEEEVEGLNNQRLDFIIESLESNSKTISNLEKSKKLTEKKIKNDFIKPAQDRQKKMNKRASAGTMNSDAQAARAAASTVISMGNALNACVSKIFAAWGAAFKKNYSQCRAVYIKAATYNKKTAKNEAALLEAVVEVSNYEVDQMMPEF